MANPILNKNKRAPFFLMISIGIMLMTQAQAFLPLEKKQTNTITPIAALKTEHHHEIVVLIHGLMRSSLSMSPLKSYLESLGYQVYTYSYPSTQYTIEEHGLYLKKFVVNLLANNPNLKIHFITHSLGGIIIREALSKLTKAQFKNIGYLIMLAPPNQGSLLAKLTTKIIPFITFAIKPLAELSSEQSSYVHRVPVPNVKIGIIAGRFDAKVPPSSAYLKGQSDLVVINATHTFIMTNATTKKLIAHFLANGTFTGS